MIAAAPQRVARRLLPLDPIAAHATGPDVGGDARTLGNRRLPVHVRGEERLELTTLAHAAPAFTFDSRSYSIRRPLEILDMTVPIGTSIIRAISA